MARSVCTHTYIRTHTPTCSHSHLHSPVCSHSHLHSHLFSRSHLHSHTSSHSLDVACYMLSVACCTLDVVCCVLSVACCLLHARRRGEPRGSLHDLVPFGDVPLRRRQHHAEGQAHASQARGAPHHALQATDSMRQAAECNTRQTTCNRQHVACNMQQTTCNRQHATHNRQHAPCNTQHATDIDNHSYGQAHAAGWRAGGCARARVCEGARIGTALACACAVRCTWRRAGPRLSAPLGCRSSSRWRLCSRPSSATSCSILRSSSASHPTRHVHAPRRADASCNRHVATYDNTNRCIHPKAVARARRADVLACCSPATLAERRGRS